MCGEQVGFEIWSFEIRAQNDLSSRPQDFCSQTLKIAHSSVSLSSSDHSPIMQTAIARSSAFVSAHRRPARTTTVRVQVSLR